MHLHGSEVEAEYQVVNALLTQLDKLKTRKNVLVVTTSNLSHAIGRLALISCHFAGYLTMTRSRFHRSSGHQGIRSASIARGDLLDASHMLRRTHGQEDHEEAHAIRLGVCPP